MSDGSVVNFPVPAAFSGNTTYASSIVDPYGLVVTLTYSGSTLTKITEPGGRFITIGAGTVTSSVGQKVTYSGDNVIYNDVTDDSGQPIQAHYAYETVQSPTIHPSPAPTPAPFNRLIWANDPMFTGPLQQVKYVYLDSPWAVYGDYSRTAVMEEHSASATDSTYTGAMVNRMQIPTTATYDADNGGYSNEYWDRIHTRGDGFVRTISYFNPDTVFKYYDSTSHLRTRQGYGQMFADHVTDWTNSTVMERLLYDWTHYFQTPTSITDMNLHVTLQTLENVCGHITRETHPPTPSESPPAHRDWAYTSGQNPYYVSTFSDERAAQGGNHTTTFIRDPTTHRVTQINYPATTSTAGLYPQTSYETFSYNGLGQVLTHRLTSGGTESFIYYPGTAAESKLLAIVDQCRW